MANPPASLSVAGVREATRRTEAACAWLEANYLAAMAQAERLHSRGQGNGAADPMNNDSKRSKRSKKTAEERLKTLNDAPELGGALSDGEISPDHLDAIAAGTKDADDDTLEDLFSNGGADLADEAKSTTPDDLQKRLKERVAAKQNDDGEIRVAGQRARQKLNRWTDKATFAGCGYYRFDEVTAAAMNEIIDAEIAALRTASRAGGRDHPMRGKSKDWLAAEALKNIVLGTALSRAGRGVKYQINVHVDLETLLRGLHDRSVHTTQSGQLVPVETIRRLACEAGIAPVVLNGASVALDVGRSKHLATAAQRSALAAMYGGCAVPGCAVDFDQCEIHHIVEWASQHGPTDLDNLIPLCRIAGGHHHAAHEGHWTFTLESGTRRLTIHRADGTLHSTSVPPGQHHDPKPKHHAGEAPARASTPDAGHPDGSDPVPCSNGTLGPSEPESPGNGQGKRGPPGAWAA